MVKLLTSVCSRQAAMCCTPTHLGPALVLTLSSLRARRSLGVRRVWPLLVLCELMSVPVPGFPHWSGL